MDVLKPYRAKIDDIDNQIIDLLAQRMAVVREVGDVKARAGIAPVQPERMTEVRERCALRGAEKGVNPSLVRKIYGLIFDEAHEIEQTMAG